jgi:hypothetical protein
VAPYHPTAPAPTMAGVTKLFATTIDIRDMTKWKAERRPIVGRKHSTFAAAELRSAITIEMRGCLMSYVTASTISANRPTSRTRLRSFSTR